MEQVALHAKRLLEENGWSYQEQEAHTGVKASVVYDITLVRRVKRDWLRQFASVARSLAREEQAREFWPRLTRQLMAPELPSLITPENFHLVTGSPRSGGGEVEEMLRLFEGLHRAGSRRVALRLLRELAEVERRATGGGTTIVAAGARAGGSPAGAQ